MNNDPFGLFIELISFDQKLIKTENEIKKVNDTIKSHQSEIEKLKISLEVSKANWLNLFKLVEEQELKIKELDQSEKEKKLKFEQVQSNKEYTSIKKELEGIKQRQYELEPVLIESWNKAETAKKEFENKKLEINKHIEDLENIIKNSKDNIDILIKELSDLSNQRRLKEQNVPDDWIEKYNIMRLRVPNPVVHVEANHCNACFYEITSQDLISLKHKKLLQCKRCYRFLYIK